MHGYVGFVEIEDHKEVFNQFMDILDTKYVGLKADHPYFQEKGEKWLQAYMKPNAVDKHLHNHKDYVRYDEANDNTRD